MTRRQWIHTGIAVTAGASGLAAAKLARQYGLVAPDSAGIYGPGEALTYATQKLLSGSALAREFSRSQISQPPFAKGSPPKDELFQRMQAGGFKDWRLSVDGMVANPGSFSLSDLDRSPISSQITALVCEEGWSYIAEWTGVSVAHLLKLTGALPSAKYVVFFTAQPRRWDSLDIADALHPQTLIATGMNGAALPVSHGGPMRLRIPRQLGYKNMKYITRLTVTDDLRGFGKGLGSFWPEAGYAWYGGI